jgi:hypothetical protein
VAVRNARVDESILAGTIAGEEGFETGVVEAEDVVIAGKVVEKFLWWTGGGRGRERMEVDGEEVGGHTRLLMLSRIALVRKVM